MLDSFAVVVHPTLSSCTQQESMCTQEGTDEGSGAEIDTIGLGMTLKGRTFTGLDSQWSSYKVDCW